jgi:C1A family cysteine protease
LRRYGCIPDLRDFRDRRCAVPARAAEALPRVVDPRATQPPIQDQGNLGSCVGHGVTASLELGNIRNGEPFVQLSRLMAYYNARRMTGAVNYDVGATIRDGVKSVARWGCAPESDWPYDIGKFTVRPPANCYADAKSSLAIQYERVPRDKAVMKTLLAQHFDIVIGFTVYDSFESETVAKSGIVPFPDPSKEHSLGGHCVRVIGYADDALPDMPANYAILANSWGTDWGIKGYFAMPWAYLMNPGLASDFWVIRKVA